MRAMVISGGGSKGAFAGGVAHNRCVRSLLEKNLGYALLVPPEPDLVGALGAALYGWQKG